MLTLGRRPGEYLVINGNVFVKVIRGRKGDFKLAIAAPKEVNVIRGEVYEKTHERPEILEE